MIFRDREDAGRRLAAKVARHHIQHPIVLALPRGGLPVGLEVARALVAPLDVLVVRELRVPDHPGCVAGAIAEGGAVCVSRDVLDEVGLTDEDVAALAEQEAIELARRVQAYRGERPLIDLAGRAVVLVDDGVATGLPARAGARAVRERGATRVILAAPVIAANAEPELRIEFDDVIAVDVPPEFFAVGYWYVHLLRISDQDVATCLRVARLGVAPAQLRESRLVGLAQAGAPTQLEEEVLSIPVGTSALGEGSLEGSMMLPEGARGMILFVHGAGSARHCPRDRYAACALNRAGFATLLFDLLTPSEIAEDQCGHRVRPDLGVLGARVAAVARWAQQAPRTRGLRLGYLGAGTGAAAALVAAASAPERVAALVSRGGRPDLVPPEVLHGVRAPTLLVVAGRDQRALRRNEGALEHLPRGRLAVVPGAGRLFEEPAALAAAARLAAEWFELHITQSEVVATT